MSRGLAPAIAPRVKSFPWAPGQYYRHEDGPFYQMFRNQYLH